MVAAAYLGSFDPHNPNLCANYLGDLGSAPNPGVSGSFSFNVASNATFVVNVIGANSGAYGLTVTGCDCTPVLKIQPVAPNQARLYWDTSGGGYVLESVSNLTANAWGAVTNEPLVGGGNYNVTNTTAMPATNRFYRLHKP
jgi:hypothetical protein